MTIAVQGAIGESGSKATTELSYNFNSLAVINGYSFGANSSGLFKLNNTVLDDGEAFTSTFTLATSDFGIKTIKRIRFLYIGIKTDNAFTVSVKADEQSWNDYTVTPNDLGLQTVRVPIGRDVQGRYWAIKISSDYHFIIDDIKAQLYTRSGGIKGY